MPLTKTNFLVSILAACSAAVPAHAFISAPRPHSSRAQSQLSNDGSGGGIEEIEFRIYPDGRITEVVRGVKGANCQDVTAAINKQLGNVVDVQPTEEMYEEEILVEQTLEQKDGGWDGASSW
mmetsp:Transcript_36996/g.66564  ORF Transcript_36996/g.66564 Transcript_36996/m.66564 type:complete len:122 (+) Transcript_36996:129-494(+)|eukprot:CAMPEP_0201883114 /NCGR_PEP_ID=MMETSP0902-20130614/15157_1 /ASSEMBLY_ACC=CAM_ASM_000551 /TAXON_ID=420261 /ORGANISM="Thalassiosira antarctica, Strain CCMP982" /LENGTH=121 /DNA_ID=CAMNT_0048411831 /DNA_START=78 /DNA_END=440 /DNA_ORIENTATION=-